jgi:predicted Fe-Mo cluster-binding NifX family protein
MIMKIAIPVENGRLHSHFGGSGHFAVVEVNPSTKATLRSEILPAPDHQPGAFPRWLQSLGVEVVIVGGIGRRALAIFAQHGIQVRAGQAGAPVAEMVAACLEGRLVQTPEGCAHHEHQHVHGHGRPHHHHGHEHQ